MTYKESLTQYLKKIGFHPSSRSQDLRKKWKGFTIQILLEPNSFYVYFDDKEGVSCFSHTREVSYARWEVVLEEINGIVKREMRNPRRV